MKKLFKRAFITFACLVLFFGISYGYLRYHINKTLSEVDQKDYTIPYERRHDNKGIAFIFPDNSATLVYLDFESLCIRLLDIPQFESQKVQYNGYTADYTVKMNLALVEGIVDRVGGVDLEIDGAMMRYTGAQIAEQITIPDNNELKQQLLLQIFEQIQKNNFSKEEFVYIIENSENNLSFIDCIFWIEYLDDMSSRISFIN